MSVLNFTISTIKNKVYQTCTKCGGIKTICEFDCRVCKTCVEEMTRKSRERASRMATATNAARNAKRRATKVRAVPVWYDNDSVVEVYQTRNELRSIGIESDVDHIIPLKHPRVCGLHCRANLQLLSPQENNKKSNKF